jgi:hypothetical protein
VSRERQKLPERHQGRVKMINEPRLVIYSGKLRDLAVLKQEYEFAGFVEIDIKQGGKVSPKIIDSGDL